MKYPCGINNSRNIALAIPILAFIQSRAMKTFLIMNIYQRVNTVWIFNNVHKIVL